jgi:hypothetical protein
MRGVLTWLSFVTVCLLLQTIVDVAGTLYAMIRTPRSGMSAKFRLNHAMLDPRRNAARYGPVRQTKDNVMRSMDNLPIHVFEAFFLKCSEAMTSCIC